ncbi:MAG: AsmA family protein [Gammaproteobacteria bacterium]
MKWLKRILAAVVIIVLLLAIGIGIFVATVDPNDYKEEIVAAVDQATGRQLTLTGDIALSIFPRLGLRLGEARLSNAEGFGDKPFASVEGVDVGVALMPLLKKQVRADKVVLKGLQLDLQTDPQGVTNWDDLMARFGGEGEAAAPKEPAVTGDASDVAVAIGGIEIDNASLSWKDAQAGTDVTVSPLNLKTGELEPGKPFDLDLSLTTKLAEPAVDADIRLVSNIAPDLDARRVTLSGVKLQVNASGAGIPNTDLVLTANAEMDLQTQRAQLTDVDLQVDASGGGMPTAEVNLKTSAALDLQAQKGKLAGFTLDVTATGEDIPDTTAKLQGDVTLDLAAQRYEIPNLSADVKTTGGDMPETAANLQARASADLTAQRYQLGDAVLKVRAAGEGLPQDGVTADLKTNIAADLNAGTVDVTPLNLQALDLTLDGEIRASDVMTQAKLSGGLKSSTFNPRKLMQAFAIEAPVTTDPNVLSKAALNIAFKATDNGTDVPGIDITLDDTKISGKAAVQDFTKPKIGFQLAIDQIDLDRYTAPADPDAPAAEPGEGDAPSDDSLNLPVDTLRSLNVNGQLDIGQLKVSGLRLRNVKATLSAQDGLVQLSPFTLAAYQGRFEGGGSVDVRQDTPQINIESNLKGLEISGFIKDLLGEESSYIRGLSDLGFKLTTSGDKISTLKQQLDGSIRLGASDGALQDAELARKVEAVAALLQGRKPAATGEELVFKILDGAAQIENGVLKNENLKLITPIIVAKGEGAADLPQSQVDYRMGIGLATSEGGAKGGVYVPIRITGAFDNLSYKLDLEAAAKERLKLELDDQKAKLEARAEEEQEKLRLKAEEERQKLEQKAEAKKEELQQKLEQETQEKTEELQDKLKEKLKDKLKLF